MRLYEFEAKKLFSKAGIPIPQGELVKSSERARDFAEKLGRPMVLKAQVLSGGRGKAGGIKFAQAPSEAEKKAAELFSLRIKGFPVETVLAEEKAETEKELYLGVTIDRVNYKLVIIACTEGGMEIEEVAKRAPEKVKRINLDIDERLYNFQAQALAKFLGVKGDQIRNVGNIISALYKVFKSYDAKLVEINPLILTREGKYIACDARMSVDDDALFRHKELSEMGIEKRHEEGEMTEREKKAMEWEIPYLDLDGDIGMFPGGAGFGIMGNDFIHYFGGRPANFMDSGGGSDS